MKQNLKKFSAPLLAVLFAVLVGSVVLWSSGLNPLKAYPALLYGAFGNPVYFGDTLSRATPIIFTGLAISISFKCGMFNIGAEGQLLVGAMTAAVVGHWFAGMPAVIHIPLTLLCAGMAAAVWGLIPGVLKAYKKVHEVITTIMMNYIALNLGGFLVESSRMGDLAETPAIQESAKLTRLSAVFPFFGSSNVNLGFFLAVATAILFYYLLNKNVFGYEVNAMGLSPNAAQNAGVNIKKMVVIVMLISAALAGLGGAERVMGIHYAYLSGLSSNFGFEGIAVALLANCNPIGVIFSAILFGALSSGGQYMNFAADVPIDIIGTIQGLIILFMAAEKAFHVFTKKSVRKEAARV